MKVKITLTEEMLGTKAASKDVFAKFIASKHPDGTPAKDELDRAENREESGTTIFHRDKDPDQLGIYDYQIKGFLKEACGHLRNVEGTLSRKVTSYKSKITGLIFVKPRFIVIPAPKSGVCERPLRGDMIVTVCRSETIPVGSVIEFEVVSLAKKFGKAEDAVEVDGLLEEWFNYGKLLGLGQWRGSGKGRFEWSEVNGDGKA